jgi:hypothetical protein
LFVFFFFVKPYTTLADGAVKGAYCRRKVMIYTVLEKHGLHNLRDDLI